MNNSLNSSLIECLSFCGVREVPPKDDGENVWIKAIAKVAKVDFTENYVAVAKGKDGEDRIIKDFGNTSAIARVLEYYPYLYLDARFVPKFHDEKKKDEKIKWLAIRQPDVDFSKFTLKELNKAVINQAIQDELNSLKNR